MAEEGGLHTCTGCAAIPSPRPYKALTRCGNGDSLASLLGKWVSAPAKQNLLDSLLGSQFGDRLDDLTRDSSFGIKGF